MNFVGSIPSSKTLFENFIFSNFGAHIDLSESSTFAVAFGCVVAFVAWQKLYNVAKFSR